MLGINGNGNGHHANGGGATGVITPPPLPGDGGNSQAIKSEVHRRLLESMDLAQARRMPREQLQQECSRRVDQLLNEQRCPLSAPEKQ